MLNLCFSSSFNFRSRSSPASFSKRDNTFDPLLNSPLTLPAGGFLFSALRARVPAACSAVKGLARSATGNEPPRCLPLTALPPAGMGQTTGQRGTPALRPAGNHFAAGRFPAPIPVGGNVLDSSFRNGTPFSLEVRRKHSPGGPFSIKMAKHVPPTKVCPFTSALIGRALWCLFRRNVPPERWNCFQKDKLVVHLRLNQEKTYH